MKLVRVNRRETDASLCLSIGLNGVNWGEACHRPEPPISYIQINIFKVVIRFLNVFKDTL